MLLMQHNTVQMSEHNGVSHLQWSKVILGSTSCLQRRRSPTKTTPEGERERDRARLVVKECIHWQTKGHYSQSFFVVLKEAPQEQQGNFWTSSQESKDKHRLKHMVQTLVPAWFTPVSHDLTNRCSQRLKLHMTSANYKCKKTNNELVINNYDVTLDESITMK